MALDKDRLGNDIADFVLSVTGVAPGSADETKLRDLWKGISDKIITEFIDNAELKSNGATLAHTAGQAATITDLAGVIDS